jgi:hypothetical protein
MSHIKMWGIGVENGLHACAVHMLCCPSLLHTTSFIYRIYTSMHLVLGTLVRYAYAERVSTPTCSEVMKVFLPPACASKLGIRNK